MNQRTLVRTDKNGTEYYRVRYTCGKCGGRGIIPVYVPINGGDCFDCGGSGIYEYEEKVYTPEYQAKLDERAAKRAAKKKAGWFEKNGFNAEGHTFLFLGNTYEMKEDIKAAGGKYDSVIGWHIAAPVEGFQFLEVSVEEVANEWSDGYCTSFQVCPDLRDRCKAEYNRLNNIQEKVSEYVGEIGQKIEKSLIYVHTSSWENGYGGYWSSSVTNLHTFKDEQGNIFTWKTGNFIEADYGTTLTVKGTIKDHSEYKGTKQTVLTRCKIEKKTLVQTA